MLLLFLPLMFSNGGSCEQLPARNVYAPENSSKKGGNEKLFASLKNVFIFILI
jgi:transposase